MRIFLLTALLLFLSFLPRSIELINKNYIFLLDQGRDYLAVKNIVVDHKLTLIGSELGGGMAGIQGIFHGPFHFYFLSLPFILFDGDPYGGVILMFLFGIATIIAAFFLGKKIFGSIFYGIIMALLVAISPPLIAQSRFVWNPHPSSLFILIAFYFIYHLTDKRKKYFFLSAFFTGFIYNFDTAISVPLTIALIVYSICLLKLKKHTLYLSLISGFVVAYMPLILFQVRHDLQAVGGISNYLIQNKTAGYYLYNHFDSYFLNLIDTFPKQSLLPSVLFLVLFISLSVFFLVKEQKKYLKYYFLFLFLVAGLTFLILSFLRSHIFPYYLIHLNFIYILLFVYIIYSSVKKRIASVQVIYFGILILFLSVATFNAQDTFRRDLNDYGGMAKIKGKEDAIKYIYKDSKGEKFGLLVFSPTVYTDPYDYLIWRYGVKMGYVPHREKSGLFYLLIEKDLSQPWTYRGWLETVVKVGKVVSTVELPSGFIIQKRLAI